jgi:Flp pilus assembly protein TadG
MRLSDTRRGSDGTATVEFVWLTILLLAPFVYILIAVFDTQRAAFGVSTASRAAARAFIQAPDVATGERRARTAARVALDDQALPDASVQITCLPSPADCLSPGSSVRVLIRTTQPLPLTPSALGSQLGGITVDSVHTEPFGTFRSRR